MRPFAPIYSVERHGEPAAPRLSPQRLLEEVPTHMIPHNEATDNLARTFLSLSSIEECYQLFEDLFTINEVQSLAQRLEVARLLKAGATYSEILKQTGVSTATIGRVNRALNYGAGGYKLVLGRISKKE